MVTATKSCRRPSTLTWIKPWEAHLPTNRTPIGRSPRWHITPEGAVLFNRAQEILACDDEQFYEEDGGRGREYLDISAQPNRALGQKAHEPSPLNCEGEPPHWGNHPQLWQGG